MTIDPRRDAAKWCGRISSAPLTADETKELNLWLNMDVENSVALERAMKDWESLEWEDFKIQPVPEPLQALRTSAINDFRRSKAKHMTTSAFGGWKSVAAACLVLGLSVGGAFYYIDVKPDQYVTQMAERRSIVLEDGSVLNLDADTRVRVKFSGHRRNLELDKGRASFAVKADPMRPFVVRIGERSVVATGTKFSVEQLSSEIRVELYEGAVSILKTVASDNITDSLPIGEVEADLSPDETYILKTNAAPEVVQTVQTGPDWENGLLLFNNEPLHIATERMNRYSAKKIKLDNLNGTTLRVSGIYKAGDTDGFLEGVSTVNKLNFRSTSEGYILSRP